MEMFIDSHTHLYLEQFDQDRNEVVERALKNGVSKLLLPNIDQSTVPAMLEMSKLYPSVVHPMIGLHPGSVEEDFREELEVIRNWMEEENFIAIGEIGIDLYWEKKFREQQEEVFGVQIEWAKERDLPIVIHARESFAEIFRVMDERMEKGQKGVFHSFTGGTEEVEKIKEYDFYFGINGIVSFKNSDLPEIVKLIPPERLLLETDSPYLAPVPKRGKRNESSFLPYTAARLADILEIGIDEIARITTENTLKLFKKI